MNMLSIVCIKVTSACLCLFAPFSHNFVDYREIGLSAFVAQPNSANNREFSIFNDSYKAANHNQTFHLLMFEATETIKFY